MPSKTPVPPALGDVPVAGPSSKPTAQQGLSSAGVMGNGVGVGAGVVAGTGSVGELVDLVKKLHEVVDRQEKRVEKLQESVDRATEMIRWMVEGQVMGQAKRSKWAQSGRRVLLESARLDDAEELEK